MKKMFLSIAALIAISVPAYGDFQTVSRAYEVDLNTLRAPASQYGALTFRECENCESVTARVTRETRYVVNGRTVSFERFWEMADKVDTSRKKAATVMRHLKSDTIVKISFNLR